MPITEQQRAAAQRRLDRAREAGDAAAEQRETSFLGQGTEPTAPAVPETTPQAGAPDQGLAIDQPGARERTEPGRPLRRDFDPGEQGQVEFTQSLNQFLGRDTTPQRTTDRLPDVPLATGQVNHHTAGHRCR